MTETTVLETITDELAETDTAGDNARINGELLEGGESDAADGDKGKTDGADTLDKDGKGDYKPKGEEEQLPWDKDRQKRDQEAANRRKTEEGALVALTEEVRSLRKEVQTLRTGDATVPRDAEAIKGDIDKLEADLDEMKANVPDEYATDEEKATYTKREAGLRGRRKVLTNELVNTAKSATAKPAKVDDSAKAEPEQPKPETVSQDDYYAVLDEADTEFGAQFRRTVAREMATFFRERTDKPPTRAQVEAKVFRLYGKHAVDAERKGKTSAGTSSGSVPTDRTDRPPARRTDDRYDFGMTTDQYVEQASRGRRRRA